VAAPASCSSTSGEHRALGEDAALPGTTESSGRRAHAHETAEEAEEETLKILALYKEFVETELAMAGHRRTEEREREVRRPAARQYSIEALMGDGMVAAVRPTISPRTIAKAFGIQFTARDKSLQYIWGTSWEGMTTRLIGGIIMTHGRRLGARLPAQSGAVPGRHRADSARQLAETVLPRARHPATNWWPAGIRVMLDDPRRLTRLAGSTPSGSCAACRCGLEIRSEGHSEGSVVLVRRDSREKRRRRIRDRDVQSLEITCSARMSRWSGSRWRGEIEQQLAALGIAVRVVVLDDPQAFREPLCQPRFSICLL